MPSMTQNFKFADGSSDSEQSFINVLDERPIELGTDALLDNGIYATFARLYDIVAAKNSLEAELDDLFAKRRAHVLEVLEKSRRRLEFIDKEEKQMKNMVKNDCFKEYKNTVASDTSTRHTAIPPASPKAPPQNSSCFEYGLSPVSQKQLSPNSPSVKEKELDIRTEFTKNWLNTSADVKNETKEKEEEENEKLGGVLGFDAEPPEEDQTKDEKETKEENFNAWEYEEEDEEEQQSGYFDASKDHNSEFLEPPMDARKTEEVIDRFIRTPKSTAADLLGESGDPHFNNWPRSLVAHRMDFPSPESEPLVESEKPNKMAIAERKKSSKGKKQRGGAQQDDVFLLEIKL